MKLRMNDTDFALKLLNPVPFTQILDNVIISEEDTEKHHIAYLVFLRLLTILILKIEDDLWYATKVFVTGISSTL